MLSLIIKKELEDLEKLKLRLFTFILIFLSGFSLYSQDLDYSKGEIYILDEITVTGLKSFNEQTVITYTGLTQGKRIRIPGEEISQVINKLWKLELFSDINFYLTKVDGDKASIEISIKELPSLSDFTISGLKKSKTETVIDEIEIKKGQKITENFIETTKNYIINKYKKNGFLNTKVNITTRPDSIGVNNEKMLINVDLGNRVKINSINFSGNEITKSKKLKKQMKKTKTKLLGRFWKKSKFIDEDYKNDLTAIVDYYKEKGYRDARIITDSVFVDGNKIDLNIEVNEGNKYYFGKINFLGNSVYSDEFLSRVLGLFEGDVYNGVLLKKRIADNTKPDGEDLTNLYQNNGYLFSTINPVEIAAENDTIDFEIRITEGKPAFFNKISVVGNDRTNDNVIYRELRTKPGELYSKDKVVRTVRELGQLGFFDPEQISPDFKNVDANAGTVDIEYGLVEKGASQVELQGGYGGGGFIGTLGLSFNNFSLKNIKNKAAWKPVPMGDGQAVSLRLQANRFYRVYSFSLADPWFGGEEPVQFSTSFSHTKQYRYNFFTGRVDKSQSFEITGASVGLAKRLRNGNPDQAKIDQERYKWLEFYKIKFKGTWYTRLVEKLVLRTHTEFGFLGAFNNERGVIPFDRFFLGGDGMSQYSMDGREMISLRGYPNQSLSSGDGSTIYNRFSLELRYPITLKPAASIFGLAFLEAGQGYDNFREFNPFNSKRSMGIGLRIFMPAFGLLGIDFGYGLDSPNPNDLNPNGWETHFVIGQQF